MKTKLKLYSLILLLIVALGIVISPSVPFVWADELDGGYEIINYDVNINVKANNSLVIKEELQVKFGDLSFGESRGIYRNIPKTLTVTRDLDGKWKDYTYGVKINIMQAKVVDTNTQYEEIYEEYDNIVIVLRDANLVNGKTRNYLIEYVYDIGYDRLETHDELYFNLLGDQWNTTIDNFSFTVNLPYEFNSQPNFYSGKFGTATASDIVNYNVTNTTISGGTTQKLNAYEALTIKLNLPNNYFDQVKKFSKTGDIIIVVATVLMVVLILYIYSFLRKRNKVVITVEFYPPNKIDPVHLAYTLHGYSKVNNLSSLIVYFANLGYLKIIDEDDEISLQKIKDISSSAPSYQRTIFNALFDDTNDQNLVENIINKTLNSEKNSIKELKTSKEEKTQKHLPITLKSLEKESVAKDFVNANQIVATECGGRLNKKSVMYAVLMYVFAALPIISFFVLYNVRINATFGIAGIIFAAVLTMVSVIMFNLSNNAISQTHYTQKRNLFAVLGLFFMGLVVLILMSTFWENIVDPLWLKLITLLPVLLALVLAPKMIIFNDEYAELFGKTLGFKKNIVLVEKKRMEMLLKDDPSYFYDILPYAYVMGITNQFIKQFETLSENIAPPTWYVSNDSVFNFIMFSHLMNFSMTNFSRNIISKNVDSGFGGKSSGGFGGFGGGFSGGGFGGGGGGRA